jgi:hypothetical protein
MPEYLRWVAALKREPSRDWKWTPDLYLKVELTDPPSSS